MHFHHQLPRMRDGLQAAAWSSLGFVALFASAASAGNVNYNFNNINDAAGWASTTSGTVVPPWTWNLEPSSSGGGWQAFVGNNSADSGTYLTSPCLEITQNSQQEFVKIDVSHRFNFPVPTEGEPDNLGQMQFRVDKGTGFGDWLGIPSAYFTGTSVHLAPNYGPPLFGTLLITSSTITTGTGPAVAPVQAWANTTTKFFSGEHERSQITLDYAAFGLANGDDLQLRFLMATNSGTTQTPVLNWEINSVTIDGVKECVVPEPGCVGLAATAAFMGLGWCARRRLTSRRGPSRQRQKSFPKRLRGFRAEAVVAGVSAAG